MSNVGSATTKSGVLIGHTTASTESARAMRYASPTSVLQCRRFPGRRLLLLCRAHATRLKFTLCAVLDSRRARQPVESAEQLRPSARAALILTNQTCRRRSASLRA